MENERPTPPNAESNRPELDPRNLIPVPTVTVDGGGRVLWINRAAEELIGYTKDVIVGSSAREWIHGRPRRRVVRDLLQWKAGSDDEISMEIPIKSAGNLARWAGLRVRRVAFRPGKPVFVASFYDLQGVHAERERLSRQLEEVEARLQEATAAAELKSEFLRVAGEQIRTPMSGLIEMSRLLLDTELTPEQRTYTEIISQSGTNLLEVVNDLLDFTRIESGTLEIRSLDFDLRVTIETVAEVLGGWITEAGRKFKYAVEPCPTALQGDPGRLRQILLSLGRCVASVSSTGDLAFAMRVADETAHGVELRIQLRASITPEDAEDAELIRQAFSEGDGAALQRLAGRGMSLRLSRQLISLMRGKIGAVHASESELELSLQIPFAKQEIVPVPAAPAVEAAAVAAASERLDGSRVLIADPFGRCGSIVVPVLELMGCDAIRVRSGQEVLTALAEAKAGGQPFDFAVLDAVLPDFSLDSMCEEIRSGGHGSIELVMTTSMGQPGDAEWASRLGFRAYLPMPIEPEDLQEALLEIVAIRSRVYSDASPPPLITRHWLAERRLLSRGATASPGAKAAVASGSEPDPAMIAPGFRDWEPRAGRSADEWDNFFGDERKAA